MNVPDKYYIRIKFSYRETDNDLDNFINSNFDICVILNKIGLNVENFNSRNSGICGCVDYKCKSVSKMYTRIEGDTTIVWFRFYNNPNDKWTFEELDNFIKEFKNLENNYPDFIDSSTIELTV